MTLKLGLMLANQYTLAESMAGRIDEVLEQARTRDVAVFRDVADEDRRDA
jgi:hypothetical protein